METSSEPTSVKPSSEASSMEAPEAGPSPEGTGPRKPTMIEPAEGAGTHAAPTEAAAMRTGGMAEARRMKVIAIDDRPAMRDVGVVVVDHPAATVPIVAPIVPTPAEAGK
jgi:hypothetical protein